MGSINTKLFQYPPLIPPVNGGRCFMLLPPPSGGGLGRGLKYLLFIDPLDKLNYPRFFIIPFMRVP